MASDLRKHPPRRRLASDSMSQRSSAASVGIYVHSDVSPFERPVLWRFHPV